MNSTQSWRHLTATLKQLSLERGVQKEGDMRAIQLWVDKVADKEKTPQWYA